MPGFLTSTAENLFKTIWGMQPRDVADTTAGALSKEDKVKTVIEDLLDKLPEEFNMQDLMSKVNITLPSDATLINVKKTAAMF